MPYPHESAARMKNPGSFKKESYKRTSGGKWVLPGAGMIEIPHTIDVISARLSGRLCACKERTVQALRFPIKDWTPSQAREWLKKNKVDSMSFDPATQKAMTDCEKRLAARLQKMLFPGKMIAFADSAADSADDMAKTIDDINKQMARIKGLVPADAFRSKLNKANTGFKQDQAELNKQNPSLYLNEVSADTDKANIQERIKSVSSLRQNDVNKLVPDTEYSTLLGALEHLKALKQAQADSRRAEDKAKAKKTPEQMQQEAQDKADINLEKDRDLLDYKNDEKQKAEAEANKKIDGIISEYEGKGMDPAIVLRVRTAVSKNPKDIKPEEVRRQLKVAFEQQKKIADALHPYYSSLPKDRQKIPSSEITRGMDAFVKNPEQWDAKGGYLDTLKAQSEEKAKAEDMKARDRDKAISKAVEEYKQEIARRQDTGEFIPEKNYTDGEISAIVSKSLASLQDRQDADKLTQIPKIDQRIESLKKDIKEKNNMIGRARNQYDSMVSALSRTPQTVVGKMGKAPVPNPEYRKLKIQSDYLNSRIDEAAKSASLLSSQVDVLEMRKERVNNPQIPSGQELANQLLSKWSTDAKVRKYQEVNNLFGVKMTDPEIREQISLGIEPGKNQKILAAVKKQNYSLEDQAKLGIPGLVPESPDEGAAKEADAVDRWKAKWSRIMSSENVPSPQQEYVFAALPDWTSAYQRLNLVRIGDQQKIQTAMGEDSAASGRQEQVASVNTEAPASAAVNAEAYLSKIAELRNNARITESPEYLKRLDDLESIVKGPAPDSQVIESKLSEIEDNLKQEKVINDERLNIKEKAQSYTDRINAIRNSPDAAGLPADVKNIMSGEMDQLIAQLAAMDIPDDIEAQISRFQETVDNA